MSKNDWEVKNCIGQPTGVGIYTDDNFEKFLVLAKDSKNRIVELEVDNFMEAIKFFVK